MLFLNLTVAQFLVLFGSAAAVVFTLYLFDRARRRQVVSTLRFWVDAERPVASSRRKRIQQPWSLLLQLLSLALLLLAIAQVRFGGPAQARDHVLLVETSAWMGTRTGPSAAAPLLMDEARARAEAFVEALPSSDRVMVVRADALATPVTGFETRRDRIAQALAGLRPGATGLNLDQSISFARQVQTLSGGRAGEVVFAGLGRISGRESAGATAEAPANLRVLEVPEPAPNIGIRGITLRRSASDPAVWEVFVMVRNYGPDRRTVPLSLRYDLAPAGARSLDVPGGGEREASFTVRATAAAILEARIAAGDGYTADDYARLELPGLPVLPVIVYSSAPESLRPLLDANPKVRAIYRAPSAYDPKPEAGLMVLDGFAPPRPPEIDALWLDPPAGASPVAVVSRGTALRLERWLTGHELGAGLRTKDVTLASASLFRLGPGDLAVAESSQGPVAVAREGPPRTVVLGFHPLRSALRYELATPLLVANVLRWVAPGVFRTPELQAATVGTVTAVLPPGATAETYRVTAEDGRDVPFSVREGVLTFFSGRPGIVRVTGGDRELVYSLSLPELSEARWERPAGVRTGIPPASGSGLPAETWPWLAALGGLGLLAEWMLFGRHGHLRGRVVPRPAHTETSPVPGRKSA